MGARKAVIGKDAEKRTRLTPPVPTPAHHFKNLLMHIKTEGGIFKTHGPGED